MSTHAVELTATADYK